MNITKVDPAPGGTFELGFRSRDHRGRGERMRYRARGRRTRAFGLPLRAGGSRGRDLVRGDEAHSRGPSLPRVLRVPAGARGADGARGAVEHGAAHHPPAALRPALSERLAAAMDVEAWPLSLRSSWRPEAPASDTHARPVARRGGPVAQAGRISDWLRILRLLGGRRAVGGTDGPRRGGPRGGDPDANEGAVGDARRRGLWTIRMEDLGDQAQRAGSGEGAATGQRGRSLGRRGCCAGGARQENDAHNVRLVKGSHIVVRRFTTTTGHIFQNADSRIIS